MSRSARAERAKAISRQPGGSDDAAPLSHGFEPIARRDARILILGSLPGTMSLARQQYYGQPRNAFWPIMATICGAAPELGYAERLGRLEAAGIALWDVLAAAERRGSLDASIVPSTIRINAFDRLFARCPMLGAVFCNGRKAADLYRRYVLPSASPDVAALPVTTLPSTSPAYAGMPQARKLAIWRAAIEPLLEPVERPRR